MTGRDRAEAYRRVKKAVLSGHRPHELTAIDRVVACFWKLRETNGKEELSDEELYEVLNVLDDMARAMREAGKAVPEDPLGEDLQRWGLAAEVMFT